MSTAGEPSPQQVRVAVDLLGGDRAPASVADAVALVLAGHGSVGSGDAVDPVLVGPPDLAADLLSERGLDGRVRVVAARRGVAMDEEPVRAARAYRGSSVHTAARLVRDGEADAVVSVGPTGAVLAVSVLTLGRVRGVRRPAVAVVVPAAHGPVVLLDAGGTVQATSEMLAQFAACGAAYARAALGVAEPRVGLLTIGAEPDKGDALRREAARRLASLDVRFVGNVEGGEVCSGAQADVVVTDGFTGNVLLKGIESAAMLARDRFVSAAEASGARPAAVAADEVLAPLLPDHHAGGLLLGVNGVVVVGHGASSPHAVAGCIALAARAARENLVGRLCEALGSPAPGASGGAAGVSA